MAQGSDNYHEPYELLSDNTRNTHRALVSVMEELEAMDWYEQRSEACTDQELREILQHNRREEVEHMLMTLEWLRRRNPEIDQRMRTYLFSEGVIVGLEKRATAQGIAEQATASSGAFGSLGIGSLKQEGV